MSTLYLGKIKKGKYIVKIEFNNNIEYRSVIHVCYIEYCYIQNTNALKRNARANRNKLYPY